MVDWKCDCGETGTARGPTFRRTITCSTCAKRENGQNNATHGDYRDGKNTRLYHSWSSMLQRCRGTSSPEHKRIYKDRGITVCAEWLDFAVFRAWATTHGYREGLTIDRLNPSLNYCPQNCEWVTKSENSRRVHQRWRKYRYENVPMDVLWAAT
jgi:hypothetical protein